MEKTREKQQQQGIPEKAEEAQKAVEEAKRSADEAAKSAQSGVEELRKAASTVEVANETVKDALRKAEEAVKEASGLEQKAVEAIQGVFNDVKVKAIGVQEAAEAVQSKVKELDDEESQQFRFVIEQRFDNGEKIDILRKEVSEKHSDLLGWFDEFVKGVTRIEVDYDTGEKDLDTEIKAIDKEAFKGKIKTAADHMLRDSHRMGKGLILNGEVAVIGDIHGDFVTLRAIIEKLKPWLGEKEDRKVLFLGDIFDRGNTTLTFDCLLDFYNANHDNVFILRGNHETDRVVSHYSETSNRDLERPMIEAEELVNEYYKTLPFAAIINGTTFASHAGIPTILENENFRNRVEKICQMVLGRKTWTEFFTITDDDADLYIQAMTWPDFVSEVDEYDVDEYGRGRFVSKMLKCFLNNAVKDLKESDQPELKKFLEKHIPAWYEEGQSPKLKNFICGHTHINGPLNHQDLGDGETFTLVTTSSKLLNDKYLQSEGHVLLVNGTEKPKRMFNVVKMVKASDEKKLEQEK